MVSGLIQCFFGVKIQLQGTFISPANKFVVAEELEIFENDF